jgi:hypothetical protein
MTQVTLRQSLMLMIQTMSLKVRNSAMSISDAPLPIWMASVFFAEMESRWTKLISLDINGLPHGLRRSSAPGEDWTESSESGLKWYACVQVCRALFGHLKQYVDIVEYKLVLKVVNERNDEANEIYRRRKRDLKTGSCV